MLRKTYRYLLTEPYSCPVSGITDQEHEYAWVKEGALYIRHGRRGYAWDGCTPTISVGGLFFIGTPDGHIDFRTGKPITYYASLVHDALTQYKMGSKRRAAEIFRDILVASDFPLAGIYYRAVMAFGTPYEQEVADA